MKTTWRTRADLTRVAVSEMLARLIEDRSLLCRPECTRCKQAILYTLLTATVSLADSNKVLDTPCTEENVVLFRKPGRR